MIASPPSPCRRRHPRENAEQAAGPVCLYSVRRAGVNKGALRGRRTISGLATANDRVSAAEPRRSARVVLNGRPCYSDHVEPRELPSVEAVLQSAAGRTLIEDHPRERVASAVREVIAELRSALRVAGDARGGLGEAGTGRRHAVAIDGDAIVARARERLEQITTRGLPGVINATGVVLHTNLGRAPLAPRAIEALTRVAAEPSALELDLESGERGERDRAIEPALRLLTGSAAALAVNNNAAALLLALNTLADRREVLVSRGELIEIGGSFRLPAILEKSGARLREVGTTNRTRLEDYAAAISRRTALVLKVHPSNYRVVGFTEDVARPALARLAREHAVPFVEDLGSGALVDLGAYGLPHEPLVGESIAAGVDVVTFSGDKLLGGPQVGIAAGRADLIAAMQKNPLKRALRVDKLTLAALLATLGIYLDAQGAAELAAALPTLRLLARSLDEIDALADEASAALRERLPGDFDVALVESEAQIGSGAQPTARLPSRAVMILHRTWPPERIARFFRSATPAIIGRIQQGNFLLDVRAVMRASDLIPNQARAEDASA
jgi:L-seryl-tRNA(Ser) seleniumtransferase